MVFEIKIESILSYQSCVRGVIPNNDCEWKTLFSCLHFIYEINAMEKGRKERFSLTRDLVV